MPPSRRYLAKVKPEDGRRQYARIKAGGRLMSKRMVRYPSDAERRGTQGACLYACQRGHVWAVYLIRQGGGFVPRDASDVFCEEGRCADSGATDEEAQGIRVSAIRWWVMR